MQVDGVHLTAVRDNGKRMVKNAGTWVRYETVMCTITVPALQPGGQPEEFQISAKIDGKVLQVNAQLESNPKLLVERPYDDGFLFIACLSEQSRTSLLRDSMSAELFCQRRDVHLNDLKGGFVTRIME